jgi:hypothetical protein
MAEKEGNFSRALPKRADKKGQVTVFIIIAIIIVAAAVLYIIFRGTAGISGIPSSLQPAYTAFLSCLEDDSMTGINVLESQGGYIYLPSYEQGSSYFPFSSRLDFMGSPVPYWYYVSANGLQKTQVPSKQDMEESLSKFVEQKIRSCNFDSYYNLGFRIDEGEPSAKASISDNAVSVTLDMPLTISYGNNTADISTHEISVSSNLGALYSSASSVYDYEQKTMFIENYTVDVMRLYAPVDGSEVTCSPKIWSADAIFNQLRNAMDSNIPFIGTKGSNGYFDADIPKGNADSIRFITSQNWTNMYEVNPSDGNLLMANPVGNQEGLGILGFCYVPYHFVYNIRYPVMIQLGKGNEIFQFPMAVMIQGNEPREPLNSTSSYVGVPDLCQYENTPIQVHTYDTSLNPIDANISYRCLGESCSIGQTENGALSGKFPQCVNGYVVAQASGYETASYLYSTTESGAVNLIMGREYPVNVKLKLDGKDYSGNAVVNIIKGSDSSSQTLIYPQQSTARMSEGQYEMEVYIYRDSALEIPASTETQCVNVPSSWLGGILGITHEKCFDVAIPAQTISSALSGGGKQSYYAIEPQLSSSKTLEIGSQSLPVPSTLSQLQLNYVAFDAQHMEVDLK